VWTGPDSQGYWRQFARRWESGGDLIVIEQDIGIHEGVIPEFSACPEPWCAFQVNIAGGLSARGLGCTKFSQEIRGKVTVQDIMCPVPHLDDSRCGGVYCGAWSPGMSACHNRHRGCRDCGSFCHRHLDGPVCDALKLIGGLDEPHVHYPPVRHFHYELGVAGEFLHRNAVGSHLR
jgi:hypothetical protein